MKKQLIAGVLLALLLTAVIAYRGYAQNAYKHAPSGGSCTLEGTEAVVATKVPNPPVAVQLGAAVLEPCEYIGSGPGTCAKLAAGVRMVEVRRRRV